MFCLFCLTDTLPVQSPSAATGPNIVEPVPGPPTTLAQDQVSYVLMGGPSGTTVEVPVDLSRPRTTRSEETTHSTVLGGDPPDDPFLGRGARGRSPHNQGS